MKGSLSKAILMKVIMMYGWLDRCLLRLYGWQPEANTFSGNALRELKCICP